MPYANSAGIQIHYEVEGSGPVLVLQHGFTQCLEDWSECGYAYARDLSNFRQMVREGIIGGSDVFRGMLEKTFGSLPDSYVTLIPTMDLVS